MAYSRDYNARIEWENFPSTNTAVDADNLNKMDYALFEHDKKIVELDGRVELVEESVTEDVAQAKEYSDLSKDYALESKNFSEQSAEHATTAYNEAERAKEYAEQASGGGTEEIIEQISTELGLTKDNYNGTSAKATADANGNNIADTYATKSELGNSANNVLSDAKGYADTKISELINGAPSTLDTLKEIADAMEDNNTVVEALEQSIGNKANTSDLTSHTTNKSNPHGVTKSQVGLGNVPNVTTNNQTPTFSVASTRVNIVSGETLSVILGKVMKFFTDLKTVAFSGSYNDLSNKPTIPASVAVKGNAETTYRTGNVNLTPANLGITVVNNTADANKNVATAVKATKDASGNIITSTYATKTELTAQIGDIGSVLDAINRTGV